MSLTNEDAKNHIRRYSNGVWLVVKLEYIDKLINEIFEEHEAQLKAKDERIKELDCRAYHAEGYISDLHNKYPKHKKFLDTKARSIVAMLFWEWRKAKRLFGNLSDTTATIQCDFEEAYKMLKDSK